MKQQSAQSPNIRRVRCEGFEEEPSEFACRWEQRNDAGRWEAWSTYVAGGGVHGWFLIDDAHRVQGGADGS